MDDHPTKTDNVYFDVTYNYILKDTSVCKSQENLLVDAHFTDPVSIHIQIVFLLFMKKVLLIWSQGGSKKCMQSVKYKKSQRVP